MQNTFSWNHSSAPCWMCERCLMVARKTWWPKITLFACSPTLSFWGRFYFLTSLHSVWRGKTNFALQPTFSVQSVFKLFNYCSDCKLEQVCSVKLRALFQAFREEFVALYLNVTKTWDRFQRFPELCHLDRKWKQSVDAARFIRRPGGPAPCTWLQNTCTKTWFPK